MLLKVRDLEAKPIRFDTAYGPGEVDFLDESLQQTAPLVTAGVAELIASVGEIRVRGKFNTTVSAECDRCLTQASFPLAGEYDLYYRPADQKVGGEEIALDDEETEVGFFEGEGVMLQEVLREQVLLALPVQRLCREDCKGLCPTCGADRNQVACACAAPVRDARWAALESLKSKR